MIRTRDLIVFVSLSLFLIGGISMTIMADVYSSNQSAAVSSVLLNENQTSFTPTIPEIVESNKTARLDAMRDKVVAFRDERGSMYFLHQQKQPVIENDIVDDFELENMNPYYCGVVRDFSLPWQNGAQIISVEGGRVLALLEEGEVQEVLLQFPQPFTPNPGAYCLPSEVVGIANDGSLIRNNEASLYGIFSDATIVGYALDGFPIFGKNNSVTTDACGGAVTDQGYGYVINDNRNTIINCYSAAPLHF